MILFSKAEEYVENCRKKGIFRDPSAQQFRSDLKLDLSSNDYFCLSKHIDVIEVAKNALQEFGAGARASRLVGTSHPLHTLLDEALEPLLPENWKGLLLGSGFSANIAFFDLFQKLDISIEYFVEHRAHASLIYAARNSKKPLFFFEHGNLDQLKGKLSRSSARVKIIVTEALHSMDGDFEDVASLAEICASIPDTFIYIDESHATGLTDKVFWSFSKNVFEKIQPFLIGVMAGCGKAVGSSGGLLLLPLSFYELAFQLAKPLIYSTALPPSVVASVVQSLRILHSAEGRMLRKNLQEAIALFQKETLKRLDNRTPSQQLVFSNHERDGVMSPIVICQANDSGKLKAIQENLRKKQISVAYIRPPTVPKGTERLRFSLNARIDKGILDELLDCLFQD